MHQAPDRKDAERDADGQRFLSKCQRRETPPAQCLHTQSAGRSRRCARKVGLRQANARSVGHFTCLTCEAARARLYMSCPMTIEARLSASIGANEIALLPSTVLPRGA